MTEKSEDQVPENAVRDSLGVPLGTGDENGQQTYVLEGEPPVEAQSAPRPYSESPDHVPDPTAMTGTVETTGTGGGAHETLRGNTSIFDHVRAPVVELYGLPQYPEDVVQAVEGDNTGQPAPHGGEDAQTASEDPEDTGVQEDGDKGSQEPVEPQPEPAPAPAKKTVAAKKTAAAPKAAAQTQES